MWIDHVDWTCRYDMLILFRRPRVLVGKDHYTQGVSDNKKQHKKLSLPIGKFRFGGQNVNQVLKKNGK